MNNLLGVGEEHPWTSLTLFHCWNAKFEIQQRAWVLPWFESGVSDVYIIQLPYEQFQLLQHVNQDIAMNWHGSIHYPLASRRTRGSLLRLLYLWWELPAWRYTESDNRKAYCHLGEAAIEPKGRPPSKGSRNKIAITWTNYLILNRWMPYPCFNGSPVLKRMVLSHQFSKEVSSVASSQRMQFWAQADMPLGWQASCIMWAR